MKKLFISLTALTSLLIFTACNDNNSPAPTPEPTDLSEEYYSGGKLGTTFNNSASAYEQFTQAIEDQGLTASFKRGERIFESPFDITSDPNTPMRGLGPLWIRDNCIHCHPGYGHGSRQNDYNSTRENGNGYLLVLTDENDNYLSSLTGMPQTNASAPFKAPLDEKKIKVQWLTYTDEWGNKFDDGETYELIYPEITIPQEAFHVPLQVGGKDINYSQLRVRFENTIGIYGTGLLDAISDDDIRAQYVAEEKAGIALNPAKWTGGDFVYYVNTLQGDGTKYIPRYTYALSRGSIQDGPGANAIWNITNVTRSDRRYHYMTAAYATVASKDPDVQAEFYNYYPEWNKTGDVEKDIYNYLMSTELPVEMTDQEYIDLMAWHRGLAVPAARDVDTEEFQLGKKLFTEMGCAYCHRPSWTTGSDEIRDPNNFFVGAKAKMLPRYPNQKIWPYTDMIQHRLFMKNDIRTGWCRTTPLWGRGLSMKCTGADDRLHDARARTVIEAIMWHGNAQSDARKSIDNFRKLNKAERNAVVKFIESI